MHACICTPSPLQPLRCGSQPPRNQQTHPGVEDRRHAALVDRRAAGEAAVLFGCVRWLWLLFCCPPARRQRQRIIVLDGMRGVHCEWVCTHVRHAQRGGMHLHGEHGESGSMHGAWQETSENETRRRQRFAAAAGRRLTTTPLQQAPKPRTSSHTLPQPAHTTAIPLPPSSSLAHLVEAPRRRRDRRRQVAPAHEVGRHGVAPAEAPPPLGAAGNVLVEAVDG